MGASIPSMVAASIPVSAIDRIARHPEIELVNEDALVTGASSGIGEVTVRELATAGVSVVVGVALIGVAVAYRQTFLAIFLGLIVLSGLRTRSSLPGRAAPKPAEPAPTPATTAW